MTTFIEKIVGDLGDKRRWRAYRVRVKALPTGCRTTVEALERYSRCWPVARRSPE
jgi:DNA-binding ferritin-like protein (Dps family)